VASVPPAVTLPGSIAVAARSPVTVDGIPLALQAAVSQSPAPQAPSGQQFWSSQLRSYGDPANDMMVIQLASPRLINYVSLSLPHFPAQYSIAWQGANGKWNWVNGPNGVVLQFIITGSLPALVDSAAALTSGLNPYHYGANHWIRYDENIKPVTASALLVAGTRAVGLVTTQNPGNLPSNTAGKAVPYPLGVQGFDFGYRVLAASDVPYTVRAAGVTTERESFAVADDINGNPVQLTMRENRASDLLNGLPWKCAPQPSSAAVVNLYVDSRDPNGNAQVIDRFYVAPTTSGVTLNLYTAPSAPPAGAGFQAVDTPLGFPAVSTAGAVPPVISGGGLLFAGQPGWCDVADANTSIDFTQPWWTGLEIQPQFGSSDGGSYFIADFGVVQLWYSGGTWYASRAGGATFAEWDAAHAAGDRIQFVLGWDGTSLTAWNAQDGAMWSVPVSSSSPAPPPMTPVGLGTPLNPNPFFLAGTEEWEGYDGAITITPSPSQPSPVSQALVLTPDGTDSTVAIESSGTVISAVPGSVYGWAGWVYPQASGACDLGFDWLDSGAYVSTSTDLVDLPVSTWSFVTFTFTAPSSGINQLVIRAGRDGAGSAVPSSDVLLAGALLAYADPPSGFVQAPVSYDGAPPSVMRFGAPQGAEVLPTLWPGNYRLTSWILKQEAPAAGTSGLPAQYAAYADGPPQQYTAPPAGPGPTTVNAVGRFDASFANTVLSPQGFVGGLGDSWSLATWTPLTSDFKLASGYLQFRPVAAAAFRFEFTNLLAQPYSYYAGTPQAAQYFPPSAVTPPVLALPSATVSASSARLSGANYSPGQPQPPANMDPGLAVGQSVSAPSYATTASPQQPYAQGAALPTETIYATDPQGAEQMTATGGSLLNFQPWQAPAQSSAKQAAAGTTAYQEISVTQQSSVAYFAGLSQLAMFKADYTTATDTPEYIETFGDISGIDPATLAQPPDGGTTVPWEWGPGLLTTPAQIPPGGYAQVSSPVYNSAHQVTGVQFAAVTSGAVQLMPDPSFTRGLADVSPAGDALPLTYAASSSLPLGSLVTVTRLPGQQSWAAVMSSYPLWSALLSPALTWSQLQGTPEASPYGGVAYSGTPVPTAAPGQVTIAARVFSSVALTFPLVLQLLDGATGSVLAEEPATVSGGTVTEWYAQCTVGESTQGTATWAQVEAAYPAWSAVNGASWSAVDDTVLALGATLSWQIIQQGLSDDTWGIDNVSIFDSAITWEFSGDGGQSWYAALNVNANPNGALALPPPVSGSGAQLMWRVTGYRPGLTVASLAIRPWYSIYPRGVPPRVQGVPHGPNVSAQDYYGPIASDPYWQQWSGPVPQAWYWAYQQQLLSQTAYQPVTPPPPPLPQAQVYLGRALITGVPVSDVLPGRALAPPA
jgi:hypothetical protein